MELNIKSSDDFDKVLSALVNEAVHANVFFKLHYDLKTATTEYKTEFNQSATFWSLTFQALLDAALFRLCRVYDTHPKSNSLINLLHTIKANLHTFDVASFRERINDNPFVDSLAQSARKPDLELLDKDIEYADGKNPVVRNLLIWRHNIFAHRSAGNVIRQKDLSSDYPLSIDDISALLKNGMRILNHYSGLFREHSYSTTVVGHDDYEYVLRCIREDLSRHEQELKAELARYGGAPE